MGLLEYITGHLIGMLHVNAYATTTCSSSVNGVPMQTSALQYLNAFARTITNLIFHKTRGATQPLVFLSILIVFESWTLSDFKKTSYVVMDNFL